MSKKHKEKIEHDCSRCSNSRQNGIEIHCTLSMKGGEKDFSSKSLVTTKIDCNWFRLKKGL